MSWRGKGCGIHVEGRSIRRRELSEVVPGMLLRAEEMQEKEKERRRKMSHKNAEMRGQTENGRTRQIQIIEPRDDFES